MLACLLAHGACAWLPDQEGLSPLDYARVRNRQGCLALLRKHIQAAPPSLKEVGPLVASFFEAPVDRQWMAWALDHYGPAKLLDARVRELVGVMGLREGVMEWQKHKPVEKHRPSPKSLPAPHDPPIHPTHPHQPTDARAGATQARCTSL